MDVEKMSASCCDLYINLVHHILDYRDVNRIASQKNRIKTRKKI